MNTPRALSKPGVSVVRAILERRNALIVHFSGTPKGSGVERGHLFPEDLLHVIRGHAQGGVSCSTVWPGDNFYGYDRNATGCIGVVLDLTSKTSLVAVDASDCGSLETETGERIVARERDITPEDVELSLRNREGYNEWVVRDFKVAGIFASPPFEMSKLEVPEYPKDMPSILRDNAPVIGIGTVPISDFIATFTNLPIYGFSVSGIVQFVGDKVIDVAHREIYSPE